MAPVVHSNVICIYLFHGESILCFINKLTRVCFKLCTKGRLIIIRYSLVVPKIGISWIKARPS